MNIPGLDTLLYRTFWALDRLGWIHTIRNLAAVDLDRIRSILVAVTTALGDSVTFTPALSALRTCFPRPRPWGRPTGCSTTNTTAGTGIPHWAARRRCRPCSGRGRRSGARWPRPSSACPCPNPRAAAPTSCGLSGATGPRHLWGAVPPPARGRGRVHDRHHRCGAPEAARDAWGGSGRRAVRSAALTRSVVPTMPVGLSNQLAHRRVSNHLALVSLVLERC